MEVLEREKKKGEEEREWGLQKVTLAYILKIDHDRSWFTMIGHALHGKKISLYS